MADTGTASKQNQITVTAVANQCLESFQKCLLRDLFIHPRELSLVEDQAARFSTWTSGIGVFASGRASMDHRLRYAPEVQSITIGLLESLNYRILKVSEILHKPAKDPETHIPSVHEEVLWKSLADIAAEISHLHKISNIIRKVSEETHNFQAKVFQIKDEEGNDVGPLLLEHYNRYIGDRFPTISDTIKQRLADTMILRRKRILYRRSRYGATVIQPPKVEPEISIMLPDSHLQQEDNQKAKAPSRIKSATTLQPEKFKMAASSPSVVSAIMTVALSNHEALNFPIAPGLHAKRKYEQFKIEQLEAQQAMLSKANELSPAISSIINPDVAMRDADEQASAEEQLSNVLKSDIQDKGEITCPYCLYTLPVEEVFNKQKWQNHVKNDLEPYVCLFEECNQPDELYKHSDKWLSHMHQHVQRWRCSSHRELGLFQTCEEYMQHMRDVHDTKLSDTKLRALANRNIRSLPRLFPSCPLCGKDESELGSRLTDHITGHLRSLAIRSLPCYYEDTPSDVGSEEGSTNSSQPRSRSTVNLSDDENIHEFWLARNEDLDDKSMPSTAVGSTGNDAEGFEDELLRWDATNNDPIPQLDHARTTIAKSKLPSGLSNEHAQAQVQAQAQGQAPTQLQAQGPQQTHGNATLQIQMQAQARLVYNRLMGTAAAKFGGPENIPQDTIDKIKQNSYAQGQQLVRDLVQRRAQLQQQQQQQQAAIYYNDRLTALPISNAPQSQEVKIPSASSSNRPGLVSLGANDGQHGAKYTDRPSNDSSANDPLHNPNRFSGDNIVVGNNLRAEAVKEPTVPKQRGNLTPGQLRQSVYQNIQQNTRPINTMTWQSSISVYERTARALNLVSNISLAMGAVSYDRAIDFGCQFEREVFYKSPTKEAYDQAMANKTMDFFKKRQKGINTDDAQAQAQAQVQALMLQAQMGRSTRHSPKQRPQPTQPMQATEMPQQQPQQPHFQQQQITTDIPGALNGLPLYDEMARLGPADRTKINELATKLLNQATEHQRANTRLHLESKLSAQQFAEFRAQGKDPLLWWYQQQAFQALKQSSLNKRFQQGGPANQNNPEATTMQQQPEIPPTETDYEER